MSRYSSCSSFKLGNCTFDWECSEGPCCKDTSTCGYDGRCPHTTTTPFPVQCTVKNDCPPGKCCTDNNECVECPPTTTTTPGPPGNIYLQINRSCSCSSFILGHCTFDWECSDGPCCKDTNTCGKDGHCK